MVCQACGAQVENGLRYCARCGAEVAPPPWPNAPYSGMGMRLPESRVRRHLETLGYLWLAYGALRIIRGLIGVFVLREVATHAFDFGFWKFGSASGPLGQPWMQDLIPMIFAATVVGAGLALLAGFSLLTRQRWGRVLSIVVAILSLIRIPFGTALGVYTFWVLAAGDSNLEYQDLVNGG